LHLKCHNFISYAELTVKLSRAVIIISSQQSMSSVSTFGLTLMKNSYFLLSPQKSLNIFETSSDFDQILATASMQKSISKIQRFDHRVHRGHGRGYL